MSELYTESYGHGKTIVMLHGWGMHSGVWRNFAQDLATDYRVICIDLPGHGQNRFCDGFELGMVTSKIAACIGNEPVVLLGWSLGGLVALEVAKRFPELVSALILIASSPCFVKDNNWPGMEPAVLNSFWESLIKNPEGTLIRFLSIQLIQTPDSDALLKALKSRVNEHPAPNARVLTDGLTVLKLQDSRADLVESKVPVLSILGALDTLVPVTLTPYLQALKAEMQVEIVQHAGHVPFLSHPETTKQHIYTFLNTHGIL